MQEKDQNRWGVQGRLVRGYMGEEEEGCRWGKGRGLGELTGCSPQPQPSTLPMPPLSPPTHL